MSLNSAKAELQDIAAAAATRNAMEQDCRFLSHGCRLYTIDAGWQSDALRRSGDVAVCDSMLTLEKAMADTAVTSVLIPKGAMLTHAGIERVCRRHGVTKVLFEEVGGDTDE
ncbi:MAG: hypothetical protein OXT65_12495 [Alphaproteobacteria bacterium]|nr:hypothetical protein [Alphaproteobacteria bacterium]